MATNAEMEHHENSELEVMGAQFKNLEVTVKANAEELLMKEEELQIFKKIQVDLDHDEAQEAQENEVVDILLVFMNNNGFKRIADKIFSFLDCNSFVRCRLVSRSWKNFIDNEWSMLQLQIFHLKLHPNEVYEDDVKPYWHLLNEYHLNFGPLIKIMEKTKTKSELRVFINMCRELVSRRCRNLERDPLKYMIDHHRHQELKMLLHCAIHQVQNLQDTMYGMYDAVRHFTPIFKYACQYGCEECVKLLLDRSEEMKIDLNLVEEKANSAVLYDSAERLDVYEYDHCLIVADYNAERNQKRERRRKWVLDLLLRSADDKGIDIHAKGRHDMTLRKFIVAKLKSSFAEIEDYSEATYRILKIDPFDLDLTWTE